LDVFSKRWGTPIVVNLLSGVFSTLVMFLAYAFTSGNSGKYFTVVLALAISTTTIAYILVFPALIKLRYSHPHVPRPYRVPGGMAGAWIVSVLTTGWAALATVALLYPGFGTSDPDAALPEGFAHQRVFYWSGRSTRALRADVPLVAAEAPSARRHLAGAPGSQAGAGTRLAATRPSEP
jgi:amino acid transporter